MKRFFKYGIVPLVTFIFLFLATIIVLPVVINVQQYLPQIEKKLSGIVERPVTIESDLAVSFFPWLSVSFSNLKVGNPEGYVSEDFVKIESFEARVKLLPLLTKKIEISRFIIGGLELNLEKKSNGAANWNFPYSSQGGQGVAVVDPRQPDITVPSGGALGDDFSIALFAVTDGTVSIVDGEKQSSHTVDDLMILLKNFTLRSPVAAELKAAVGGNSFSGEGTLGPFGEDFGLNVLPLDLRFRVFDSVGGQVKGTLANFVGDPEYDLHITVPPFSAKELMSPVMGVTDIEILRAVAMDFIARGDTKDILIEKGKLQVDDSLGDFDLRVSDSAQQEIEFSLDIDQLELDRYLGSVADMIGMGGKETETSVDNQKKTAVTGEVQVKTLKVGGGTLSDVTAQLQWTENILKIDPVTFTFYQGEAKTYLAVDFQKESPEITVEVEAEGVTAKPFINDFFGQDFLSGTLGTDVRMHFSGRDKDAVLKSFYADGEMDCRDGVLHGIDMVDALNNVHNPKDGDASNSRIVSTDFSVLKSDFSIRNGLATSRKTLLQSPLAKVEISGSADLLKNQLELMIEPKAVAVITKTEEGESETSEGSVPFSLSGDLSKPKISIDAQYMSLEGVSLPRELDLQSYVDEKLPSPVEEDVKDLVGTTLIDPAVVAQRFGLQREYISKTRTKKHLVIGTGRVKISPLQREDSLR